MIKKKVIKKAATNPNAQSVGLLPLTKDYYGQYGKHVISNRAIPDFRDGLKPIQRAILWAAREMSPPLRYNSEFRKSARLVGEILGKYHPHGDMSTYGAMINMAAPHTSLPYIDGQGNFGTVTDDPAGMRYTEVRLTKYADLAILPAEYLPVIEYHPNYDDMYQIPLNMPALYPNLLLNGTFGIAVGVSCGIPPLHIDGLMTIIQRIIEGKSIDAKLLKKYLRFNYPYKPNCTSSDEEIMDWLTSGHGALVFSPNIDINYTEKLMIITGLPSGFNWETVVKRLSAKKFEKLVAEPRDMTDKTNIGVPTFGVKLKTSVPRDDIADAVKLIAPVFNSTAKLNSVITHRLSETNIKFEYSNIGNILMRWTQYRIDLERAYQKYLIEKFDGLIANQELMALAVANKKIIMLSLEQRDPAKYLSEKLKITLEQSNYILDKQIRSLSRMSGEEVRAKILELKDSRKTAKKHHDNPETKTIAEMNANLSIVENAAAKRLSKVKK